jgi:hypothetical protein
MASSEMLRHVALVITDVTEELRAPFISVTRIGELGTLAVNSNRHTLGRNTFLRSERRLLFAAKIPRSSVL